MLLYNVSRAAYNIIGSRGKKNHNVLREKCKHFSRGTTCKHQPELFIHSHCCRSLLKYVEPCELMLLYNVSRAAYNIIGSRGTKNHNVLREKCKHFSRGTTCKHQPELFIHSHCCRSLLKYVEPCEQMLLYNVSRAAYNIIGSRGTKNHNVLREKCKHFSRGTTCKHQPELF